MPKKQIKKIHRHFVVLPFFLLAFILSLLPLGNTAYNYSASIIVDNNDGYEILTFPQGVHAIVSGGNGFNFSDKSSISFIDGSAIIWSEGISVIHVLKYDLFAIDGAYNISVFEGVLTVAAINTPVLIRQNNEIVLVPVGMQWRSSEKQSVSYMDDVSSWIYQRKVQNVPKHFLQRQRELLSKLQSSVSTAELPKSEYSLPSDFERMLLNIRLPQSKKKALLDLQISLFGYARNLLDSNDIASVHSLIYSPEYLEIFSSREGEYFLSLYLHSSKNSASMSTIVPFLSENEEMALLLSFHPNFQDTAWVIANSPASVEARLLRLFMLPISDRQKVSINTLAMSRWMQCALEISSSVKDPSEFYSLLIKETARNAMYLNSKGYPKRAKDWADILRKLADNVDIPLSKEAWNELNALERLHSVDVTLSVDFSDPNTNEINEENLPLEARRAKWGERNESAAPPWVKNVEEYEINESFSPDVVESRTYSILQEMGAVFMVETSIAAVAPNTAEVNNILFSTSKGDFVFSFSLDVSEKLFSNITSNGQTYPYGLSKEAFEKWIFYE